MLLEEPFIRLYAWLPETLVERLRGFHNKSVLGSTLICWIFILIRMLILLLDAVWFGH